MSQRQTAAGEQSPPSSATTNRPRRQHSLEEDVSVPPRSRIARSSAAGETSTQAPREPRAARGSDVHAILNPLTALPFQSDTPVVYSRADRRGSNDPFARSGETQAGFRSILDEPRQLASALLPREPRTGQHGRVLTPSPPSRASRHIGSESARSSALQESPESIRQGPPRLQNIRTLASPFGPPESTTSARSYSRSEPQHSPATETLGSFSNQTLEGAAAAGVGSGASSFQYMTLETEHGPVSFPVDIRAASRMADEKRRRNAGASARFRQRRKEKEHANARELEELREQIRDLEEDADFYRAERDYFARLTYNAPDRDRHFPRPLSPRHTRVERRQAEAASRGSFSGPESSFQEFQEYGEREAPERYTRRRLSTAPYEGEYAAQFHSPVFRQPTIPPPRQPGQSLSTRRGHEERQVQQSEPTYPLRALSLPPESAAAYRPEPPPRPPPDWREQGPQPGTYGRDTRLP